MNQSKEYLVLSIIIEDNIKFKSRFVIIDWIQNHGSARRIHGYTIPLYKSCNLSNNLTFFLELVCQLNMSKAGQNDDPHI